MTTICIRDGIVAADSRATNSGWTSDPNAKKLFRARDGRIIAICGTRGAAEALCQSLLRNVPVKERPTMKDDGAVIEIFLNGKIIVHEGGGTYSVSKAPFYSWGSGFPAAKGAMHMGATARQAVRIASLLDECTGGRIVTMRIGSTGKRR